MIPWIGLMALTSLGSSPGMNCMLLFASSPQVRQLALMALMLSFTVIFGQILVIIFFEAISFFFTNYVMPTS